MHRSGTSLKGWISMPWETGVRHIEGGSNSNQASRVWSDPGLKQKSRHLPTACKCWQNYLKVRTPLTPKNQKRTGELKASIFAYQWSGSSPWTHCLSYTQCGHRVNRSVCQEEEGARHTLLLPACFSSIEHSHTSVAPLPPPIPRWPAELLTLPTTFSYSLFGEWFILRMVCW